MPEPPGSGLPAGEAIPLPYRVFALSSILTTTHNYAKLRMCVCNKHTYRQLIIGVRTMPKIRHPDRRPRTHRKKQIEQFLLKSAERYGECYAVTALEIAEHLQVKKSTHLSQMLCEMVDEGRLKMYPTRWLNGWHMWLYTLPDCELEQQSLFDDLES